MVAYSGKKLRHTKNYINMKKKKEIGDMYIQNVNGTIFKHKIVKYLGIFNNKHYYVVENTETKFRFSLPI